MSHKDRDPKPPAHTEDIDPAPWLGRVGDGATLPSGEYISRQLREMAEHERAHREEERTHKEGERVPRDGERTPLERDDEAERKDTQR